MTSDQKLRLNQFKFKYIMIDIANRPLIYILEDIKKAAETLMSFGVSPK